ncbi:sigma-70 family RNA polymerase sigma factor [Jiangella rhizosphaerae]|uniref:RNA polymerase sigma factor n=1 Tax=Jiangella rhizosphaerae TaxID=2293569 RepID=A0A418KM43_9ACTN|nr:sigma-70 family RNA polymerase sigma factor [Jiangella rhizosphaerae]RIQ19474.1 sigma-70 family RNA polymerase sigma factor [Jiangella rhizosphaerae]
MTGDDEFMRQAEAYRRELLAHCYRMMGSFDDAEDLVQETYLRAWRSYDGFEGRSSLRTWLYRIATNACLNALQRSDRRAVPVGFSETESPAAGVAWLQPLPDALVTPESADPAAVAVVRDGVRLALIVGLQYLTPRQRAVLILRDVLAWPAAEVATALDLEVGAVKSLLQRARTRLREVTPSMDDVLEPSHPRARELLERYMTAFATADARAFEEALRADAVLEMPSAAMWFAGKVACVEYLMSEVVGVAGDWRKLPTVANGQPAFGAYLRDGSAFGMAVLTVTDAGIARVTVFAEPDLLPRFGLPASLP